MPYVTSVERIGIEKGVQQGIPLGMLIEGREMLVDVLNERFGTISADLSKQLESIDSRENLKALFRQSLKIKTLKEFEDRVMAMMDKKKLEK